MESKKPTQDQVLEYAEKKISYFIYAHARNENEEIKEEIAQECRIRVLRAYQNLDDSGKWKSYIQRHCEGAVKDYCRRGDSFEEENWGLNEDNGHNQHKLNNRISELSYDSGDSVTDVELIAGIKGVHSDINMNEKSYRWDILARMASKDPNVLLVAKLLMGFSLTSLAEQYGLSRERLGQKRDELAEYIRGPRAKFNPWLIQLQFALGIESDDYKIDDNGVDRIYPPADLFSEDKLYVQDLSEQLNLFDI